MTIVQGQTTNGTFAIDALGTLNLSTFSPVATSTFTDTFTNSSKLTTLSSAVVSGGDIILSGGSGNYASSGTAISTTTSPAYLVSWGTASSTITTPARTTGVFHIVDGSGTVLPDAVLPGNSVGFITSVNLSSVSTSTYPSLALSATLTSTATSSTPTISNWGLSYQYGPVPLPNIGFSLTGAKTIGSTGAGAPIYKTNVSGITNSGGLDPLSLEWDSYSLLVPSYDIVDACTAPPYALSPGTTLPESLILVPTTGNTILVAVTDSSGNPISGATVSLSRSGFTTQTVTSSSCGNAYFGNLTSSSSYTVSIAKSGYTSNSANSVNVSGETFYAISF
jgi:hypothetical protein